MEYNFVAGVWVPLSITQHCGVLQCHGLKPSISQCVAVTHMHMLVSNQCANYMYTNALPLCVHKSTLHTHTHTHTHTNSNVIDCLTFCYMISLLSL